MLKIKLPVLLLLASLLCTVTYGQGNSSAGSGAYTKRLDILIAKGNRLLNNADSLKLIIKGFEQLNTEFHDNASIVYTDYYKGEVQWLSSDDVKAMQSGITSLNEAIKWKVTEPIPYIYGLIGQLHKENANYPMAFIAAQNGLNAAIQNRDTPKIIELMGVKAMFKRGYALHFNKPLDQDSSLIIRLQALKIAESDPKYERTRVPFYDNISQHYFLTKNYPLAIAYAKKGIALATKLDMQRSLTYSYDWLANALYCTGDKTQAAMYYNMALQVAGKLKQPFRTMEIYKDISNAYASSNDYANAFHYLQKYQHLMDSLQVRKNEQQISELQIKYESAKKDKDLALLNLSNQQKDKQLIAITVGAALFLLFLIILAYTYTLIRKKNDALKAGNAQINEQAEKLQTLMQELHHRVKNNLQVVSSLLMLQANRMDKNAEARDALNVSRQRIEAMSIIHNSLYQHGSDNRVHLKEFLSILLNNLLDSFGINRADMNITLEITVNDLDVDTAMPLGLIINEWVTNIFKHAYKNMHEKPGMEIHVFNNDSKLKVKIKDNGAGMPLALWENPKGSLGVKLMKILIKQLGGKASVLNSLGTTFELDIPYLKIT